MTLVPVSKLTKRELVEINNWTCPHAHSGLSHYTCWLKYGGEKTRVGFFDIETSNLAADYGILLSYCIKEEGKNRFYGRALEDGEVSTQLDEGLIKECIAELKRFDTLITFYGTKFDLPFIRSRALFYDIDFPTFDMIKHIDCYYIAKFKLRIHSNRLESVCDLLGIKGKTHIKPIYWIKGLQGSEIALKEIWKHNKPDTITLEKAYNRLKDFTKGTKKSI